MTCEDTSLIVRSVDLDSCDVVLNPVDTILWVVAESPYSHCMFCLCHCDIALLRIRLYCRCARLCVAQVALLLTATGVFIDALSGPPSVCRYVGAVARLGRVQLCRDFCLRLSSPHHGPSRPTNVEQQETLSSSGGFGATVRTTLNALPIPPRRCAPRGPYFVSKRLYVARACLGTLKSLAGSALKPLYPGSISLPPRPAVSGLLNRAKCLAV